MEGKILKQYSETDRLREVVIGRVQGYCADKKYIELVNEDQKKGLPDISALEEEFSAFRQTLESRGIMVHIPDFVGKFVYDQLTPRDIGVTIGDKFVICNMVHPSRRYEIAGILTLLHNRTGKEPIILLPPDGAKIEGGDIIVDKGRIFVGISQRTNEAGARFLQHQFGDKFEVITVYCKSLEEGENVLHLDCTFNPVGTGHCLIYPDGFVHIPDTIREHYTWIEVDKTAQAGLATNVLSIDPSTVLVRDHESCTQTNNQLRNAGFEVIELHFDAAPETGGSFRCCSLPLYRE